VPKRLPAPKKSYPSAVAVERAADILASLAERKTASVMELAAAVGLSGSAVHRILTALKRKGLIEQDTLTERYSLSWGILALARSLVNEDHLRAIALNYMIKLRDLTGETVTLYVRAGFDRICIEQVESSHEIRYRAEVGRLLPLHAGASGLALLAFAPESELEEFLRVVHLESLTDSTLSDTEDLRKELARIRARGYCFAKNDRVAGLAGLSTPILDAAGFARAVVTIAGPTERIVKGDRKAWAEAAAAACSEVATVLDGRVGYAEVSA
jgi:IclR family transcriptional regulator, acetate operon repressor